MAVLRLFPCWSELLNQFFGFHSHTLIVRFAIFRRRNSVPCASNAIRVARWRWSATAVECGSMQNVKNFLAKIFTCFALRKVLNTSVFCVAQRKTGNLLLPTIQVWRNPTFFLPCPRWNLSNSKQFHDRTWPSQPKYVINWIFKFQVL